LSARRVHFDVSPELAAGMFTNGPRAYIVENGLPEGATLQNARIVYDGDAMFLRLVFEHESFPETEQGLGEPLEVRIALADLEVEEKP
jgi:hypothetical protein